MFRRSRELALITSVVVLLPLLCAGLARAADPPARALPDNGRVVGTFTMSGIITTAVRIPGEQRGEQITRTWVLVGNSCSAQFCTSLSLRRERSAGQYSNIVLTRTSSGSYEGSGVFYAGLRCLGKTYSHGQVVPYRITLQVTKAVTVEGEMFAQDVAATYVNSARTDTTPCPTGPSHDAASYTGAVAVIPSTPSASFSVTMQPSSDDAVFSDTSTPSSDGAPIVAQTWNFGDPASGAADSSTLEAPNHQFAAPGVYTVSLTVLDADGLTSTATKSVTAPGPPVAAFSATEIGTSMSYTFTDRSSSGIGGAPITGWSWSFGDPNSSQNTSASQDPTHVFTAPGSYTVSLTVTDANGRTAITTKTIAVPSGSPTP